jgi:hypothetical protein
MERIIGADLKNRYFYVLLGKIQIEISRCQQVFSADTIAME